MIKSCLKQLTFSLQWSVGSITDALDHLLKRLRSILSMLVINSMVLSIALFTYQMSYHDAKKTA